MVIPPWTVLGHSVDVLQGAAAGGVVYALIDRRNPWYRRATNGCAGALVATFLTPWVATIVNKFLDLGEGRLTLAFILGVVGVLICEALLLTAERIRSRAPALADQVIDRHLGTGTGP
jgi:xanthosine utilization system XapX-like protein